MTSPRFTRVAPLLVLASLTLAACPKKPQPVTPVPSVNEDSLARERQRLDSLARAEQARRDSLARMQAMSDEARMARERAMEAVRAALTAPIYFEYDQAELSSDARAVLDAKVPALSANDGVRLRIAGHTDSRGSDEYNLALGQRRAAAAKRYLTQRGIAESRMEVVSFGEEQPSATGEDESSWSRNRRAEFELTAGGESLSPAP